MGKLKLARLGVFMIAIAAIFFLSMLWLAPRSTDPAELLRFSGGLAGAVAGVGFALLLVGIIRLRRA